jgi:hypothetical protein
VKSNPAALSNQAFFKNFYQVGLFASIFACVLLPPMAFSEPADFTQMKVACRNTGGRPASEYYNDWVSGGGCVCPGSSTGSGKVSCPSTGSGYSGGRSSSMEGAAADLGTALGHAIGNWLFGNHQQQASSETVPQQQSTNTAADDARQAALQRQQEQQRLDQRQQEQQQQDQQRREQQRLDQQKQDKERRDEATKQELLGSIKGTGASDLTFKRSGSGPDLQFKTTDSAAAKPAVIHDGFSLPTIDP